MITEQEIREYVAFWMAALQEETPLEAIEALKRVKELMYNDLRKEILNRNVSGNWVRWWDESVGSIFYGTDWKNAFGLGEQKYDKDSLQLIPLEDIPGWIDGIKSSEATSFLMEENVGYGSGVFDDEMLVSKKSRRRNKLDPDEEPPEVTLLDVVFCNLCELWDGYVRHLTRLAAAEGTAERDDYLGLTMRPYHGMSFTISIASEITELRTKYGDKKKIPYEATKGSKWMNAKEEECYHQARSLTDKKPDDRTLYLSMKRLYEELERRPGYIKSTLDDFFTEKSFYKNTVLPLWGLDVFEKYHGTGRCTEQLTRASKRLMSPGVPNMYRTWDGDDIPVCALMYALRDDMEFYRKQVWLTTGEHLPKVDDSPDGVGSGTQPLLSRFDGVELLAIHRRLTDAAYLDCTGEEWLYVWGVSIHPHSRKAIAVPTRRLVWSCEKGRKSALAEMIRLIKTSQCGNYWEKTARWFRYTNGEKPDAEQLKSQRLKGASAAAFKTLVLGV